jgi:hypothetical protein
MSDAKLADPFDACDDDSMCGVLVDAIEGDATFFYRRFKATWLKVVAPDDHCGAIDEDNLDSCMKYQISITPVSAVEAAA